MAARRSRPRPTRLLLVLGLLVLLCLLFELNRFLPGGWPGGSGDSGFRRLDVAGGEDPTRVKRPEGWKADWTPKDGVTLSVRGPEANAAAGWRVSVGAKGSPQGPEPGGERLRVTDKALTDEGFTLRWSGGVLSHAAPPGAEPLPFWRVALPGAPVAPRMQPQTVVVEVRAAEDGTPLAEATVAIAGRREQVTSDAQGRARLTGLKGLTAIGIAASGRLGGHAYAHPQSGEVVQVLLERPLELDLPLLDPLTRQPAAITQAQLRAADGRVLWEAARAQPARNVRLTTTLAPSELLGAHLEVEAPGRPRTRAQVVPDATEVLLSAPGRVIEVRARDVEGRPVKLASAQVRYDATNSGPGPREDAGVLERLTPDADGLVHATIPATGAATIVVEGPERVPASLRVDVNDSAGPREVTLVPGLRIPVLVLDARGRPVREASVVARVVLDGVRVEARAPTGADGRARVGPFAAGPVEVLAHAPGRAWAAMAAEAAAPMESVELRLLPGGALTLQVETPFGAPLGGVRVAAVAQDDGPVDVEPPEPASWITGPDGRLAVPDLPLRPYRLRLDLAGYASETLDDITPGPILYFATLVPTPR